MSSKGCDLDETLLDQLKSERPELREQLLRRMHQALKSFSESPSFSILEHMPVQSVVTLPEESRDQQLTFCELVDSGVISFCEDGNVSGEVVEAVTVALEKLVAPEEKEISTAESPVFESMPEMILVTPSGIPRKIIERDDIPVYGSVESEKRISEGFSRILSSEKYDQLKSVKVEKFWPQEVVSAPFIESMRIAELVSMRVDDLLKKRSFGMAKIHGLLCCLDKCLASIGEAGEKLAMPAPGKVVENSEGQEQETGDVASDDSNRLHPASMSFANVTAQEGELHWQLLTGGLELLIRSAPSGVLQRFLQRLINEYGENWLVAQIFSQSDPSLCNEYPLAGVEDHYKSLAPESHAALMTILRTAGTDETTLLRIAFGGDGSSALSKLAIQILLPACGAQEVQVWDQRVSGFWSSSQAAVVVFDGLLQRLPLSESDFSAQIEGVLPMFPAQIVKDVFSQRALFEESSAQWQLLADKSS